MGNEKDKSPRFSTAIINGKLYITTLDEDGRPTPLKRKPHLPFNKKYERLARGEKKRPDPLDPRLYRVKVSADPFFLAAGPPQFPELADARSEIYYTFLKFIVLDVLDRKGYKGLIDELDLEWRLRTFAAGKEVPPWGRGPEPASAADGTGTEGQRKEGKVIPFPVRRTKTRHEPDEGTILELKGAMEALTEDDLPMPFDVGAIPRDALQEMAARASAFAAWIRRWKEEADLDAEWLKDTNIDEPWDFRSLGEMMDWELVAQKLRRYRAVFQEYRESIRSYWEALMEYLRRSDDEEEWEDDDWDDGWDDEEECEDDEECYDEEEWEDDGWDDGWDDEE